MNVVEVLAEEERANAEAVAGAIYRELPKRQELGGLVDAMTVLSGVVAVLAFGVQLWQMHRDDDEEGDEQETFEEFFDGLTAADVRQTVRARVREATLSEVELILEGGKRLVRRRVVRRTIERLMKRTPSGPKTE